MSETERLAKNINKFGRICFVVFLLPPALLVLYSIAYLGVSMIWAIAVWSVT